MLRRMPRTAISITGLTLAVALGLPTSVRAQASRSAPVPDFERDVLPILTANCVKCHGAGKPQAGLDLRTPASMLRGGDSGPALLKTAAERSLLWAKVSKGEMPPGKAKKLSATQIQVLRDWIDAGAPGQRVGTVSPDNAENQPHWAFRRLSTPRVPHVEHHDRARTPIDRLLLAQLEPKGLSFAADADRVTLLRRVYFDLWGLPPTLDELDAFLADPRPDAYERLLDRLLASPRFGERWARHWLDVVGYTDTVGFDQDMNNIIQSEGKWRYRDYVISAINDDVPYDRFVTEQLAGDELVDWRHAPRFTPEIRRQLIATGYLRTARDQTHEPESNIPLSYYGVLEDTVAIVGNSLLGLTLGCAQCHSHKFDPIPQRDYYQLMALFTPAYNPRDWRPVFPWKSEIKDRGLPDASPAELAQIEWHNKALDAEAAELSERLAKLRRPYETRLRETRLAAIPEAIRADTQAAIATPANKRTEVQKYLAAKFEPSLRVTPEEVAAALNPAGRSQSAELNARIAALRATRRTPEKLQAMYDVGPPPPTYLLERGSYETPGEEVAPGFLSMLCEGSSTIATANPSSAATSGRRLALARWLTERGSRPSALLARVMVNRLWQHLFGRGLVPTPDNFGRSGEPPTHPELLEWLSGEFGRREWRIKPMLKLMMMSTAYRQASRVEGEVAGDGRRAVEVDPENRLLSRMRLRRLEAEPIRDALLAVAGQLDATMGGPPVVARARPDGLVETEDKAGPAARARRSVYLLYRRSYNHSLLTVFDQPLVAQNCAYRDASAVPLQSLTMLNDAFVTEQAKHFARRVEQTAGATGQPAITAAFRLALARSPTAAETAVGYRLLDRLAATYRAAGRSPGEAERLGLVHWCHALVNTSEFLYVE